MTQLCLLNPFLQCAIPVFENLLTNASHNTHVRKLLFELATWHGLAKLRLHTKSTLNALDTSTTRLGKLLRQFEVITERDFKVNALPSEEAARGRRLARAMAKSKPKPTEIVDGQKKKKKKKLFSLKTYKMHSLGDYVWSIRRYGTTDSNNTQIVSNSLATPTSTSYLLI